MNPQDCLQTLLGYKKPVLNFLGGMVTVTLKVTGLIYSSKMAVGLLLLVMLFDWAAGVYKAIKLRKFNSFTFQRMLVNIFFTMALIGIAYQMSLVFPLLSWLRLPEFLIGGFMATYFFSVFENLHQADAKLIPPKMYTHAKTLLDLDKILAQYFKPLKPPTEDAKEKKEEAKPDVTEA